MARLALATDFPLWIFNLKDRKKKLASVHNEIYCSEIHCIHIAVTIEVHFIAKTSLISFSFVMHFKLAHDRCLGWNICPFISLLICVTTLEGSGLFHQIIYCGKSAYKKRTKPWKLFHIEFNLYIIQCFLAQTYQHLT